MVQIFKHRANRCMSQRPPSPQLRDFTANHTILSLYITFKSCNLNCKFIATRAPIKTNIMLSSRRKACLAFATASVVALSQYSFKKSHDRIAVRRRLQEDVSVNNVASITLIGERHSGTNWITDHLRGCFGDELRVRVDFVC